MANLRNDDLFPEVRNPHGTCVINERCLVRTQDGYRVVSVSGVVLAQYAVTDRMAEAHAMVSLVDRQAPERSRVGIIIALLSLVVMPLISRAKRSVGARLHSPAMNADAAFHLDLGLGRLPGLHDRGALRGR